MVTPYGVSFAVHLITNHFGNLVAKVCENLLRRGPLPLEQLVRFTELTRGQVKNCLLVLVQHNCAQAFVYAPEDGDRDGLKARTHYLALCDNILHRLRFPKFLEIVLQELGDECVELLDGLLRDGRLTLKQMVDRASQGKENAVVANVVQENLRKLLMARYVERCPAPEVVVSIHDKEQTTSRKRGAKAAKKFEAPETIEHRVLEAAIPGDAIRFLLTADTGHNADKEIYPDDESKMTDAAENVGKDPDDDSKMTDVPENVGKDPDDDSKMTDVPENVAKEDPTLWRANFEEFIRQLRHKALIENVRTRLDDGAATVLSAILKATRTAGNNVKIEKSVPLSLDTILNEVMKTEHGRTMTFDRVKASLVQLGCPQRMLDDQYSIDLKNIIELARNEEVESIVLKRYGSDAYRMFRYLSRENCFRETDKIAESTLVENKEAPKLLYKLWKDNYLYMEKLFVSGAKQSKFLMWKVDKPLLGGYVLDEMYHAALNLSLRMAYEQEKDEELLNVPKDKLMEPGPLKKKYQRLLNVWSLLGSSLMKLDDALMLFHDF